MSIPAFTINPGGESTDETSLAATAFVEKSVSEIRSMIDLTTAKLSLTPSRFGSTQLLEFQMQDADGRRYGIAFRIVGSEDFGGWDTGVVSVDDWIDALTIARLIATEVHDSQ